YTLKSNRTEFRGGKNMPASEHVHYVHGGGTIVGTAFPEGIVEVGTLGARHTSTGNYEPVADGADGALPEGFQHSFILNEGPDTDGESDFVSGAVIIEGSVYTAELPEAPAESFKNANPNIHYVQHI